MTETYMDANPCTECGMSDWWCLYEENCGRGRCCGNCGPFADVHGPRELAAAVSHG
ncbi:hypothetical protein [Microbispora triticiradicis]|uniref:hypothetical protein n=1 Tax=Microbispora triticiradicis TaxID=2200763 RepID=UPI001AD6E1E9|nr:hypothetical protein [Microbispora triticiradicis]MBO4275094.1 hypothetical protein [Microbispora triticiradicis]